MSTSRVAISTSRVETEIFSGLTDVEKKSLKNSDVKTPFTYTERKIKNISNYYTTERFILARKQITMEMLEEKADEFVDCSNINIHDNFVIPILKISNNKVFQIRKTR